VDTRADGPFRESIVTREETSNAMPRLTQRAIQILGVVSVVEVVSVTVLAA
jgi:hypothetical protein